MAYGDRGDGWSQRPPGFEEEEPPVRPRPPAKVPGTPAEVPSGVQVVDAAYVEDVARQTVPGQEQLRDFLEWSRAQLGTLRDGVLAQSGVDIDAFAAKMRAVAQRLKEAEEDLNEKATAPHPAPGPVTPLPGSARPAACTSTFDANDLALRGRKSVLDKRYYMPIVFPELLLTADQKWRLGQKLEYRQEWRHAGFTLGELITSLSLLPNEELTIEVSSWQRTRNEIAEEENAETRQALEREQRRTDEESAANHAAASEGWSISATGAVSYGPASASASAQYSSSVDRRAEVAERHIAEATRRASTEVSLRRAVKITQTSEAGSESTTTRRIKNPNTLHTVTYNFFQIVKLYDVQLRPENDAATLMMPGIFPARYRKADGTDDGPAAIPYWVIESFTSPANFLTQFFDLDRDLSQEIFGWALRARTNPLTAPEDAPRQLAEALIVAVKYLLGLDPAAHMAAMSQFVANYAAQAASLWGRAASSYGPGLGRSEQMTTPGIYADSLLGSCSAGEDYIESSRYLDVMRQHEELVAAQRANRLSDLEIQRREELLKKGKLEPFEPPPAALTDARDESGSDFGSQRGRRPK